MTNTTTPSTLDVRIRTKPTTGPRRPWSAIAAPAFLQPSLVLREERVEPLAVHLALDLLGADEDGEPDAGEDACILLVDPDLEKGLQEHLLADGINAALASTCSLSWYTRPASHWSRKAL